MKGLSIFGESRSKRDTAPGILVTGFCLCFLSMRDDGDDHDHDDVVVMMMVMDRRSMSGPIGALTLPLKSNHSR